MYKGIIEAISGNTATVRIPELNKIDGAVGATPSNELATSVICTLPGYIPNLRVGDIVIVGLENFNVAKPIILGLLFNDNVKNRQPDIFAGSINVSVNATLPKDTTIGEVSAATIEHLIGLESNAQLQLNELKKQAEELQKQLNQVNETIEDIQTELDKHASRLNKHDITIGEHGATLASHKATLDSHTKTLDDHEGRIKTNEEKIGNNEKAIKKINEETIPQLEKEMSDKIEKIIDPIILTDKSYGTKEPDDAIDGQLFFLLKG